ncbi:MAG: MFS transporter, partial [Candidatus Competibacteraceae bacterium]|nr:MFS transporter [Candidatus Competibacteraceae bacterium]
IFSVKQTGVPAGGALAGAILPLLVALWDWRVAALSIAALALLVLLLLQPLRARFDQNRTTPQRLGLASVAGPIALVLSDPVLRRLTLVAFAYAGCQVSVGAFYVVYLVAAEDMTLSQAGSAFAFVQMGGIGGRLLWGSLAGRWINPRRLLALIGLLTAASLFATTLIQPDWPFLLLAVQGLILGASSFGWNGVFLSEAASLAPAGRAGDTTGGVQFIMFGGVVVVPPLFGLLAGVSGSYAIAFYAVAAVALSAVGFLLWDRRSC